MEASNANIKGRDIVLEDLRQLCLWENLSATNETEKWWSYINKVHQTCYSVINEDCSRRAHTLLGLDWTATNQCVSDSFGGLSKSEWGRDTTKNAKIDKEIDYWTNYGTNIYPSVVINKKTYRG
mgnify:CR=1 FL=1